MSLDLLHAEPPSRVGWPLGLPANGQIAGRAALEDPQALARRRTPPISRVDAEVAAKRDRAQFGLARRRHDLHPWTGARGLGEWPRSGACSVGPLRRLTSLKPMCRSPSATRGVDEVEQRSRTVASLRVDIEDEVHAPTSAAAWLAGSKPTTARVTKGTRSGIALQAGGDPKSRLSAGSEETPPIARAKRIAR